jgi:hypothetical protein
LRPSQFERRVGPHALDLLDRVLEIEQRRNLDEAADGDSDQDANEKDVAVPLEELVIAEQPIWFSSPSFFRSHVCFTYSAC